MMETTPKLTFSRQLYHDDRDYPDCFEEVPEHPDNVRRLLRSIHPDSKVVVVDYHC